MGRMAPGGQVAIGKGGVVVGPASQIILVQVIVKIPTVGVGIIITVDGQVTLESVIGIATVIVVESVAVMVLTVGKMKEDAVALPGGMVPWPGSAVRQPTVALPWPVVALC